MSIRHIEDMPVEDFIDAIRNLNEYDITEKIDGFNLRFGIDDTGFYTTGKADIRKYRATEYGKEFRYSGFKSAHMALARVLPKMLKTNIIRKHDEIEVEVLFGRMPNTVPYSGDTNKIIILKKTAGSPNIRALKAALHDIIVTIQLTVPITTDGKTIKHEVQQHDWLFSETPRVEKIIVKDIRNDKAFQTKLDDLESFLNNDSGIGDFTNAEIISMPLNQRHASVEKDDWKDMKRILTDKRKILRAYIMNHKLDIKTDLLNDMVRKIQSDFGPKLEDGGWIEGVVLNKGDEVFKIVDKDMFTALNQFNWKVRKAVASNAKGPNKVESIIGKIKVAMATEVGHPDLGSNQKTRYVKAHELTTADIEEAIKDFDLTKGRFIKIMDKGIEFLSKYHVHYDLYKRDAEIDIDFGPAKKKYKIDSTLDEKNLESFAELYDLLYTMRDSIYMTSTKRDLAELIL